MKKLKSQNDTMLQQDAQKSNITYIKDVNQTKMTKSQKETAGRIFWLELNPGGAISLQLENLINTYGLKAVEAKLNYIKKVG